MAAPIVYEVDRIRDGKSFSARRVQAIQHGRPILSMISSFQVPEPGLEHQPQMPEVPPPEQLPSSAELRAELARRRPAPCPTASAMRCGRPAPIEFRPSTPWNPLKPTVARADAGGLVPHHRSRCRDDPMLHRCLLAYASDYNLIPTALRPHGKSWFGGQMVVASIDHALWFHRDARVDDWLLYVMDSPCAQAARGIRPRARLRRARAGWWRASRRKA